MENNNQEGYPYDYLLYSTIVTVYILALYSLLVIGNCIWYLPRILKLQSKQFHVAMFTLNQLSFISNLVAMSLT
mgnify:CR=1 FL=1